VIKASRRVDVIIPVFNGEQTIDRAIKSVLAQSLELIGKIIVIDDGSTDRTREVVSSIDSSLIQVETKKNGGVASARNRGIELTTSHWIAFLDADDVWESEKLKAQLDELTALPDVGFICCNAGSKKVGTDRMINSTSLWRGNFVATSSVIVERVVAQNLSPLFSVNMKFGEDYLAWFEILSIKNGYYVDKPLVQYFVSPEPHYRLVSIGWHLFQILQKGALFTLHREASLTSKFLNIGTLLSGITLSIFSIMKRFIKSHF
jgi:glycosyltransferase involved in cell wall biosynthesis